MQIDRIKLEKLTTLLAVTLLGTMVIVLTLVTANYAFDWDLFPPPLEKAGIVIIISSFWIILSSVIINIMLNIGRIADRIGGNETHGEIKLH